MKPVRRRVHSTLLRLVVHVVNTVSNLAGDDVLGCRIRRRILRSAGAVVPRSTHIRGGTYFTCPGHLRTGERCTINRNCYLDLEATITLADDVVVGHGTTIVTSTHSVGPAQRRTGPVVGHPVCIGTGVWIGANVTILPGVTIGAGSVVGTAAVVISDVPPDVVVAGTPARVRRRLDATAPADQNDLSIGLG